MTTMRPSGRKSMHNGKAESRTTTSCFPSRSIAMISCAAQSDTQKRPSDQRGDSPNMRPDFKIFTSVAEDVDDIVILSERLAAVDTSPSVVGRPQDERASRRPTSSPDFFVKMQVPWVSGGV